MAVVLLTVLSGALPGTALADPSGPPTYRQLAGVGSATTEAVMNELAATIFYGGQKVLGSYDATGSATITTSTASGCTITRPSGDVAGDRALWTDDLGGSGCLGFARVSNERELLGTDPSPWLDYLPFAQDSVSFAVLGTGTVARRLSLTNLRSMYRCQVTGVRPVLPATGSMLRNTWLAALDLTESEIGSCAVSTVNGVPVKENDARVLDGTSIVPFSVSQFIAQMVGKAPDSRRAAALGSITGLPGGDDGTPVVAGTANYPSGITFAANSDLLPNEISQASLQRVYKCFDSTVAGTPVTPMLPNAGPVRAAWLSRMVITETELSNGDYPCVRTTVGGNPLPPNDTRSLPAGAIVPVSAGEWARQMGGLATDTRGSAYLGKIGDQPPLVINLRYSPELVHRVFNAIPSKKLGATPWREVFAGPFSLVCQHTSLITSHGFAALPAGECGVGRERVLDPPDSSRKLTGLGSSSTESVMSALAETTTINGEKVLGSYGTVGSPISLTDPQTGATCNWSGRGNSDWDGAFRMASSSSNRCIDFARMSGPFSGSNATIQGFPTYYVPFALDSMTYAITENSSVPRMLTQAQLQAIYRCQNPSVVPQLPGVETELRARWLRFVGITQADISAGTYPCIQFGLGRLFEDNDGRVLRDNSVMPYSVASYVAQFSGAAPDRHGRVVLGTIGAAPSPLPVIADLDEYPEGLSFVVRADRSVPRRLSIEQLIAIYTCQDATLTPMLPGPGGLRDGWLRFLGLLESDIGAGLYPCVKSFASGDDDARGLVGSMVMPYSVLQYSFQLTGVTGQDYRKGTVLGVIDPGGENLTPAPPIKLNTGYSTVHPVYNAVPEAKVNASPTIEVFVGPNALLCQQPNVLQAHGFAPIPAGHAEPCGSLQHSNNTGPVQTFAATVKPVVALDSGRVPGSGMTVSARHGRCTLSGSYINHPQGAWIEMTARVSGPRCSIHIDGNFYRHITGETLFVEQARGEFNGSGSVTLRHEPGTWAYHHLGDNNMKGDSLYFGAYYVRDVSSGAPGGNGYAYLEPYGPAPGVHRVNIHTQSRAAVVTWDSTPGAVSYRVYRRTVSVNGSYSRVATVPQSSCNTRCLFGDENIPNLYKLGYIVRAVFSDGFEGNPSIEVEASPAAPFRIKHYVALGDSYASGEGAGAYWDGGWGQCHRSRRGYAPVLRDPADPKSMLGFAEASEARFDFFACSGARIPHMIINRSDSHIQPRMEGWQIPGGAGPPGTTFIAANYQIEMLKRAHQAMPIDLVTLSIGGNDVGFVSALIDCLKGDCTSKETTYRQRITDPALKAALVETYRQVLANSGDAYLKVIGYPRLFPPNGPSNCALPGGSGLTRLAEFLGIPAGNIGFTAAEMTMFNRMADELNSVIASAVNTVAQSSGLIGFISTTDPFIGHDMCASAAWINKFKINLAQATPWDLKHAFVESAHPNATGHGNESTHIARQFLGT